MKLFYFEMAKKPKPKSLSSFFCGSLLFTKHSRDCREMLAKADIE